MKNHATQATENDSRASLMRACSRATEAEMRKAIETLSVPASSSDLRPPETGLVMVRGRIGGIGDAFNIGEAVVTRASVRLDDGRVGHSYLLGRSVAKARLAATIDALGQDPGNRDELEAAFVAPVIARMERERAVRREEAAATRVNFFTLVRGEDT